jgi:hypothetical protein
MSSTLTPTIGATDVVRHCCTDGAVWETTAIRAAFRETRGRLGHNFRTKRTSLRSRRTSVDTNGTQPTCCPIFGPQLSPLSTCLDFAVVHLATSQVGYTYWSHDIGGHQSLPPPDLYTRWVNQHAHNSLSLCRFACTLTAVLTLGLLGCFPFFHVRSCNLVHFRRCFACTAPRTAATIGRLHTTPQRNARRRSGVTWCALPHRADSAPR